MFVYSAELFLCLKEKLTKNKQNNVPLDRLCKLQTFCGDKFVKNKRVLTRAQRAVMRLYIANSSSAPISDFLRERSAHLYARGTVWLKNTHSASPSPALSLVPAYSLYHIKKFL